jgi:hypothetical protein
MQLSRSKQIADAAFFSVGRQEAPGLVLIYPANRETMLCRAAMKLSRRTSYSHPLGNMGPMSPQFCIYNPSHGKRIDTYAPEMKFQRPRGLALIERLMPKAAAVPVALITGTTGNAAKGLRTLIRPSQAGSISLELLTWDALTLTNGENTNSGQTENKLWEGSWFGHRDTRSGNSGGGAGATLARRSLCP